MKTLRCSELTKEIEWLRNDGYRLDMIMPALDGWGVRQKQMEDPQLSEVPVIILTGAPLPSLVHAQLHAADYLLKPVGRDHLISVVSNYCQPAVHAA